MSVMLNPCILLGKASLNYYMSKEEGAWMGAYHFYDHLNPFIFGEDPDNVPRSYPSSQEIRNRLSIENGESRQALMKFLESV
jgi:hypothetical protein